MEHLALEIFDLATKANPKPTGSQYAMLEENASITITDTSEIFASGDVWSHSFTLNVHSNSHIFGTSGDLHGSRLHEQIDKRRARLWVEGLPLYLGYLKLDDEVEVDADGNVDVRFESGQKTFEEMIEGISATEVSVGDVIIGVALNRKRVVDFDRHAAFTLDGLKAYANKEEWLQYVDSRRFSIDMQTPYGINLSPYAQRWPKLVKSHGEVLDSSGSPISPMPDYTNVQTPYDAGHPFCNINICYPFKSVDKQGNEVAGRGYTIRLAHGEPTVDGGDNQTRFNNAPNFYLLYFIDRLFKDMNIHIVENQAKDVEDLRRVFMLNYGCHYEEIENESDYYHSLEHTTPNDRDGKPLLSRYGQYYLRLLDERKNNENYSGLLLKQRLVGNPTLLSSPICTDSNIKGKVLMRDVEVRKSGVDNVLSVGSVEGTAFPNAHFSTEFINYLDRNDIEKREKAYSAYLAYATKENYPHVEISEIVNAMKAMFGVRLLFNSDLSTVRIILLRNVFRDSSVQDVICEITDDDEKVENRIRGFRMTYGKGTDDTGYYYKGFADLFARAATTWKDTSDKYDYSQWEVNADYNDIKQYVSAFNKTCYVTPVNGNAYGIQVDEDEDVLFPSLFEWAGYMDAEDGDCSQPESDGKTIEEVQCGATPVIMNEAGLVYASLFSGDLNAPTPDMPEDVGAFNKTHPALGRKIATFGRGGSIANFSQTVAAPAGAYFTVSGKLDYFISEGFQIRMKDNYAISNGGTPFDEADPGLCFGIMRGSGDDAYVRYFDDVDDDENDTWEVEPGSGAVSNSDTCDNYGNLFDYNGHLNISTPADAAAEISRRHPQTAGSILAERYPVTAQDMRDAGWGVSASVPASARIVSYDWKVSGQFVVYGTINVYCTPIQLATHTPGENHILTRRELNNYIGSLFEQYQLDFVQHDTKGLIYAVDPTDWGVITELRNIYFGDVEGGIEIDNGLGGTSGRFSLKLRAEKPNPFFDPRRGETNRMISTRGEAGQAMLELFTTANTALLARPIVDNSVMRTAGWECPDDGYVTVFGQQYGVEDSNGRTHRILWTPIKENGTVKTPAQLQAYASTFNGLSAGQITAHDTEHLILDIDTTDHRAEMLHKLQEMYYADGETTPFLLTDNLRYLTISNPDLRGRGLADQFYKEYSWWVRNARIVRRTVRMELAQLLAIDKTVRVRVGDITGFIRKMEYSVSNDTGLGMVKLEIMYI